MAENHKSQKGRAVLTLLTVLLMLCYLLLPANAVQAAGEYSVLIQDDADLLTDEEEAKLSDVMEPITEYGNVMFASTEIYMGSDAEENANETYQAVFGSSSGMIFFIDMSERVLTVYSNGDVYRIINRGYARTITDNVYTYASDGDYFTCAQEAFTEAYTLLEGGSISQPMRLVTNIFLAFVFAFLIAYLILTIQRSRASVSRKDQASIDRKWRVVQVDRDKVLRKRTYYISTGGSGGSSGGGGGSSGGGGGGGGGGGSHGF